MNPLHKKAAPWCLVLNPALCIKCKPWGLVLKKYHQVGRWVASLGPARIALFYEDGLSMTVRYVAIIAPSCTWVSSAQ